MEDKTPPQYLKDKISKEYLAAAMIFILGITFSISFKEYLAILCFAFCGLYMVYDGYSTLKAYKKGLLSEEIVFCSNIKLKNIVSKNCIVSFLNTVTGETIEFVVPGKTPKNITIGGYYNIIYQKRNLIAWSSYLPSTSIQTDTPSPDLNQTEEKSENNSENIIILEDVINAKNR